jgi:hypothetical protein
LTVRIAGNEIPVLQQTENGIDYSILGRGGQFNYGLQMNLNKCMHLEQLKRRKWANRERQHRGEQIFKNSKQWDKSK